MDADICSAIQLPMEVTDGTELGARGAALSAAVGVGAYRDDAEAVEQAVSIVRVQEPIPANTPHYLRRYAEYERLVEVMQAPWEALCRVD